MNEILWPFARLLHDGLPAWVRLPDLTFQMPHWLYWSALVVFPLVALFLYAREQRRGASGRVGLATACLLWLTGGYVGLHRFYARSFRLGMVFVVLFLVVLFGNIQARDARNTFSNVSNDFKSAQFDVRHYERQIARGRDRFKPRLEEARKRLADARIKLATGRTAYEAWPAFVGFFAWLIGLLMLIDLLLLPGLVRRADAAEAGRREAEDFEIITRGPKADPRDRVSNPFTRAVGAVSGATGNVIALWSVIAVFVYYYEVVARYVFNSPTNWAHESMFIMFGMQYVLAGAFAYRDESHVRVDVIYEKLSVRTRAILDIVTSTVFFLFTGTLLITSFVFATQAMPTDGNWEVSFTEWQLEYWPAKLAILVGAALIVLQGLARLVRDIQFLILGAPGGDSHAYRHGPDLGA